MLSILPDLPQTKKRKEADITPKVEHWFHNNYPNSFLLEIKASRNGKTIPKSAVLPHQLQALKDAMTERGIVHKLSDEARRQQPADVFGLKKADAFVVACFPKKGICYAISPLNWQGISLDSVQPHYAKHNKFHIQFL